MRKKLFWILFYLGLAIAWFAIFAHITTKNFAENNKPVFGVTFSKSFAEHLKLDWHKVYLGALDELKFRKFRIGLNWNEIEPTPGKFNFSDFDWMVGEAEKRNAKIILGIGRRLPRWPECHTPDWAKKMPESEREASILAMIETSVNHFKNSKAVAIWQVENEPFFRFFSEECQIPSKEFVKKEIALVRKLDPSRPIMVTDSGELSSWANSARLKPDILGISIYRYTWNKHFGFFKYFLPPWFYNIKGRIVNRFIPRVIVSELQAEPWAPNGFLSITPEEEKKTMSGEILNETIDFARRTGYDDVYFWGLEWWYFKKEAGDRIYWQAIRLLNNEKPTIL